MIPPLLRLMIREPALLAEHVGAYSSLARLELRAFHGALRRRIGLWLLLACSLLCLALLGGMSLLLWASLGHGHWLHLAVPAAPLAASIASGVALLRQAALKDPLERTWDQFDADLNLLKDSP